ncbi:MAG: hypothetical protein [Circular genetic element sp.]|nr:MAG: hypothetical protein [Circular genetic element sp.]
MPPTEVGIENHIVCAEGCILLRLPEYFLFAMLTMVIPGVIINFPRSASGQDGHRPPSEDSAPVCMHTDLTLLRPSTEGDRLKSLSFDVRVQTSLNKQSSKPSCGLQQPKWQRIVPPIIRTLR